MQATWGALDCTNSRTTRKAITLPAKQDEWVKARIADGDYTNDSEYIRDLIRRDQDRDRLRRLLLEGATSAAGPVADDAYFEALRNGGRADA